MNRSVLYDNFNGYNAYPAGIGEEMIRGRLSELFGRIVEKNEGCFIKAREKGLEKILSRVLQVRTRMERMKHEIAHREIGGEYTFEKMSPAEEYELREVDLSLERIMNQTYDIMNSLTCLETEMHLVDRFTEVTDCLRAIEHLCHKRIGIFRKQHVYG